MQRCGDLGPKRGHEERDEVVLEQVRLHVDLDQLELGVGAVVIQYWFIEGLGVFLMARGRSALALAISIPRRLSF